MIPSSPGRRVDASPEDYQWLTGQEAARLLETLAVSRRPLAAEVSQLRREFTPARTHLLVEQVELRERARAKFALADQMFFTRIGLEQASGEVVADYKARRFRGASAVFDMCCGIGGDLLSLARVAPTTGIERDEVAAILAAANARLLLRSADPRIAAPSQSVRVGDVACCDTGRCDAWHIDPDRRPQGRRTTRAEMHEPGVEVIGRLLATNRNAAIKLAPAAELPIAWSEQAELEWISHARECRQLVAWFGNLSKSAGRRRATILGDGSVSPRTLVGIPGDEPPASQTIDRYVFEPDPAVLAAGLGPSLAVEHDWARITPGVAYWTGDRPVADAALACFEVHDVLPLDLKRVKALLRERNIGRLEIKKRGVDLDPEALRRRLGLRGEESATLIVTNVGGRVTAIRARRVS